MFAARTTPFLDAHGDEIPGSIATLEMPTLGGVRQSVLIRGRCVDNPILLYLHGGPGTSELGILRVHSYRGRSHIFPLSLRWKTRKLRKCETSEASTDMVEIGGCAGAQCALDNAGRTRNEGGWQVGQMRLMSLLPPCVAIS